MKNVIKALILVTCLVGCGSRVVDFPIPEGVGSSGGEDDNGGGGGDCFGLDSDPDAGSSALDAQSE